MERLLLPYGLLVKRWIEVHREAPAWLLPSAFFGLWVGFYKLDETTDRHGIDTRQSVVKSITYLVCLPTFFAAAFAAAQLAMPLWAPVGMAYIGLREAMATERTH